MRSSSFLALILPFSHAFVSPTKGPIQLPSWNALDRSIINRAKHEYPSAIQKQRKSIAPIQTMGLFGLGGFEIAIILVAGAFVLGPEKLGELSRGAGKMSSDLTDIPKEFQKGFEEGETEARSRKAKPMELESEKDD